MKKGLSTPLVLLSGLFTAQVGFMLLVYVSNHELLAALKAIHGTVPVYFTIPAGNAVTRLGTLSTAFNGGLFFTFTLGAGLSAIAFFFGWLWHHLFGRNKTILCIAFLCWAECVVMLNYNGPQLIISGTLLLIFCVVFFLTVVRRPPSPQYRYPKGLLIHILLVFLSVGLMGSFGKNIAFSNFRDSFLLSNSAGIMINDFYYRYTLHAARVFKPLHRRNVNTCFIDTGGDHALGRSIEKILVNADFFPVTPGIQADLAVIKVGQHLWLSHGGKKILQCGTGVFLKRSSALLKQFSFKTDGYIRFRQMIYWGLVAGLPVFMYLFSALLLQSFLGKMGCSENWIVIGVPAFIIFFALALSGFLAFESRISPHVEQNPVHYLASPHVRERIGALKVVCRKKIDISEVQVGGALVKTCHVAERYWAARALSYSRGEGVKKRLLCLLEDSQPNVVCQALYALGKRGDKRDLHKVIHKITTSDHWYIQWYGYRAVKQLGWKQGALN
ncbi:HEAT repeat domain-containing protein [Desulfocicer niacini]